MIENFKENNPGLNSIEKILNFTEENFIKTFINKEPFNGDIRKARKTYREALRIQEQITLLWANIKDTVASPSIKEALFNNIPDSFLEFQNLIPAYNRIFGNLDFIECEHTRSIFGPAAYFVDLLRFIEKHIVNNPKNNIPVDHKLQDRQPRLFNLALDKENTFNLIPYIDLVNEVLEDFVRTRNSSPYEKLEKAKFPIDLPFHLPLEEIRIYLKQLKIKLEDIYRLFSLVGDNAFANLPETSIDGDKSKQIYKALQKNNILDFNGRLTAAFQPDTVGFSLELGDEFNDDEQAIIDRLKEYKAVEPEIAREILALSPREYKLLEKEISAENIYEFYGIDLERKELFTTETTNFSNELQTALNNSTSNFVEVLELPVNEPFKTELEEKELKLSGKELNLPNTIEISVISPDKKWQLFIPQSNIRYSIEKDTNTLTFYQEASLKGKGSLEDVEKFIEQTKITDGQLKELLYLDLSNDEINANLNSLFFINNTGDGKGSLRRKYDCENELFRTNSRFYQELDKQEFSEALRNEFPGLIEVSNNIRVLVDVFLAKKSDKWLLKDIDNKKEYILQKNINKQDNDKNELIVYGKRPEDNVEDFEEKFKIIDDDRNNVNSIISELNDSKFPAKLKEKFDSESIVVSEKIKISKWKTEKWQICDVEKDKTYVVRHDKNELIIYDEPYDCLENLTPQKLDRIYRFLKLARKLEWSYSDLDWALRSLQNTPTGEKVLNFDGVNDYVAISNIPKDKNPFTPDITLEAWVQPALAGYNPIFTVGSPDGNFTQFQFFITPLGKLGFFCNVKEAFNERDDEGRITKTRNWYGRERGELAQPGVNSRLRDLQSDYYFAQPKDGGDLVAIDLQEIPGKGNNNQQHGLVLLSNCTLPLGTFSHVAVTIKDDVEINKKACSQLNFYINGTLSTTWNVLKATEDRDGETITIPALDVTTPTGVKKLEINIGKDLLSEYFSGAMTDVRLWNDVRSTEEIAKNRFKRLTGREENLASYWAMVPSSELQIELLVADNPELQVLNLVDPNSEFLHGILGGSNLYTTPVWINGDLVLEPFPAPVSIYAYNFNGIDQYVGSAVKNLDNLEKFTLEAQVKITEVGTHPIISLGKLTNNQIHSPIHFWIDSENKLAFTSAQVGNNKLTSSEAITINTSTHIALIFDGVNTEFYINGIKSDALDPTAIVESLENLGFKDSTLLYLGRDFSKSPNYLKGTLQEVRIWDIERTATQIEKTRHYQLDGSEENLVGYWRLNEFNPQLSNSSEPATRDRSFNENYLYPGGIPELYEPREIQYDDAILPDPVAETSQTLHFGANQYNVKIENKQRYGLGYYEQFTVEFWFKADEPLITRRPSQNETEDSKELKQLLFTQGDEDNGLSIYLSKGEVRAYAWSASLELRGNPQEYKREIKQKILFSKKLIELEGQTNRNPQDWHHLTFTYDETVEQERFSINDGYSELNDFRIPSSINSGLSLRNSLEGYQVVVDIPNRQWRIRDFIERKTFLIRRNNEINETLTIYEKTPQDEIAFRFYIDGQLINEKKSNGYSKKDSGFRLDQVGDIYLGNRNSVSSDQLVVTRFDDGFDEGAKPDENYFKGQITDFRLWAIAFPKDRITNPKNRQRNIEPTSTDNLLCYLPMTEGFGRSVSDHKGPLYPEQDHGYGPQILDQSPNIHHGKLSVGADTGEKWQTVSNLPVFRDTVLKLNGKDQYLLLPCAEDLGLINRSFTIEVWLKVATFQTQMPIIGSISPDRRGKQNQNHNDFYLVISDQGKIVTRINDLCITSAETLSPNHWHHLAWSFELETGLQKLYLDGQPLQNLGQISKGLLTDLPLYLGLRRQEPSNDCDPIVNRYFQGEIAELRIWHEARTIEQIEKWWNIIPQGEDATPEAYWVFDRDPRTVLLDRTEHHHRAILEIDSSADIEHKWIPERAPLKRQAITVQLNEHPREPIQYIDLDTYEIGQQGTIEIWAKFSRGERQVLFDGSTENPRNLFCLEVLKSHQLQFQVSLSCDRVLCAQIDLAEFPEEFESQFHHLVATWELSAQKQSGAIKLICDTFYKAEDQQTKVKITSEFKPLYFGISRNTKTINGSYDLTHADPFYGEFSQIRIWETVRSHQEILRLQYADLAGDEENLQVYLPIEEGVPNGQGAYSTLHNLAACGCEEIAIKKIAVPDPTPEWQDVDWAVELDGDDDFIEIPKNYQITSEGTIEIWAKFDRARDRILFDASNDDPSNTHRKKFFILEVKQCKLRFGLEDRNDYNYVVEIDLSGDDYQIFDRQWHHIAATWKYEPQEKKVKAILYIDGFATKGEDLSCTRSPLSKLIRSSGRGEKPEFESLYFGKLRGSYYPWSGDCPSDFDGSISQIRIWNCHRNIKDIQNGRDEVISESSENLLIYLPIKEGQGIRLENQANRRNRQNISAAILQVGNGDCNDKWINIERSIRLDGREKFIELPEYVPTPFGTIELWAKFSRDREQIIFDASDEHENIFLVKTRNQYLEFIISDRQNNEQPQVDLLRLPDNFDRSWHHLVITWEFDGQNTVDVQFIIDGSLHQEYHQTLSNCRWIELQNLYFGIKRTSAEQLSDYLAFEGEISQIRIWNCVRSQQELEQWRYAQLGGSEPGLLYYLPILDGEGFELSNYTSRESREPGLVKTGVFPNPEWHWKNSTLLDFNHDYAVLPKTSDLKVQENSFTIEAWVKLEDFNAEYPIIGVRNPRDKNNRDPQFLLFVNTEGHVALKMGTNAELEVDEYQLELHIWHHIICTYDYHGRVLKLIVIKRDYRQCQYDPKQKKLVIRIELEGGLFEDSSNEVRSYQCDRRLYLGYHRIWNEERNNWLEKYFKGNIDEVRFWDCVLTEDQIEDLQDRRLRGDEPGLVAYWPITGEYNRTIFSSGSNLNLYQIGIPEPINPISELFTTSQPKIYSKRPVIELDGYNDYLALGNLCFNDPPSRCLEQSSHTFEFWFRKKYQTEDCDIIYGDWQHIAATFNGSSSNPVGIFLNGAAIIADSPQYDELEKVFNSFHIGLDRPSNLSDFPQGQIAELRFWWQQLTQQEVANNFKRYLSGREGQLWALWRLDEGKENHNRQSHDISETLAPITIEVGLENTLSKWVIEANLPINCAVSSLKFDGENDHIPLENSTSDDLNLCNPENDLARKTLLFLEISIIRSQWELQNSTYWWLIFVLYRYYLSFSFTIEAWLKVDTSIENHIVLGTSNTKEISPNTPIFSVGIKSKKPFISFGKDNEFTANYQLGNDTWHLLTWQYDAFSGKIQILINAGISGSEVGHVPYPGNVPIMIGAGLIEDDRELHFFKGQISEIRIWNTWRTQEEIQERYENRERLSGTQEVLDELVAYWIFDDRNKTIIPSRFPDPQSKKENLNPYQLILESDINHLHLTQPEWEEVEDRPILLNSLPQEALSFDGDRQYLATDDFEFVSNSFTFEAWIKITDSKINPIIWWGTKDENGLATTKFELRVNETRKIEFFFEESTPLITSNIELESNKFTHLAFTFQPQSTETRITIYINGEAQGTDTTEKDFVLSNQVLQIGRGEIDGSSTYFTGNIQEVRICNEVRSSIYIQAGLYHPLSDWLDFSNLANCIAYWSLNSSELIDGDPYALNHISGRSHLRLGGLKDARKVNAGDPVQFIDPRRKVLDFPLDEIILPNVSIPRFDVSTFPEHRMQRTIEVWFLAREPFTTDKQIIYAEGISDRDLSIYLEGGSLHFEVASQTVTEYECKQEEKNTNHKISTGRIQANVWHHAALVLDGRVEVRDNALIAFLDARLIDTQPGLQIWGQPEQVTIGGFCFEPDLPHSSQLPGDKAEDENTIPFKGQIAYLQVWASARNIEDIKAERFNPQQNQQVFYWDTANVTLSEAIAPMFIAEQSPREVADSSINLEDLAFIREVQTRYKQPINRLSALWGEIKHTGVEDNRTLFDDIFNPSSIQERDQWSYNQRLVWEVDSSEAFQRQIRSRLMSSLRVSSEDLDLMVEFLSGDVSKVIIDGDYLNQLYRLKQMVILFKISVKDLVRILEILSAEADNSEFLYNEFNNLANFRIQDINKVQERVDWLVKTGIDVPKFDYLVLDKLDPRLAISYTEAETINTATDLLNQSQEYLVIPEKLESEGIEELAAIALYEGLLTGSVIKEITLQLPTEDNNSFNGVNFGVVQNSFKRLNKRTYLDVIAGASNWLEAFTGLAISLKKLQRKSYSIFDTKTDYSDALNSGNLTEELRAEFKASKYQINLSSSVSISAETWQMGEQNIDQQTIIPEYIINLQNDVFRVYKIDKQNNSFLFDIDPRFNNQLNRQVFPEELISIFKYKEIEIDISKQVNIFALFLLLKTGLYRLGLLLLPNYFEISEDSKFFVKTIEWKVFNDRGEIKYIIKDNLSTDQSEPTSSLEVYDHPSKELLFELSSDFAKNLSKGIVSEDIQQEFSNQGKQLAPSFTASSTRWLIEIENPQATDNTDESGSEAIQNDQNQEENQSIEYQIELVEDDVYQVFNFEVSDEDPLFAINTNFVQQFRKQEIPYEFWLIFNQKLESILPTDTQEDIQISENEKTTENYRIVATEWVLEDEANSRSYAISRNLETEEFSAYGGWLDSLGKIVIREKVLSEVEPDPKVINGLEISHKDELREIFSKEDDEEKEGAIFLSESFNVVTYKWLFDTSTQKYAIAYQPDNYTFNIYELDPELGEFKLFNWDLGLVVQLEKGKLPDLISSYLETNKILELPNSENIEVILCPIKPSNNPQTTNIAKQWRIKDKNKKFGSVVATIQLKHDGNFYFFASTQIDSILSTFDPIVESNLFDSKSDFNKKFSDVLEEDNSETLKYSGKEWRITDIIRDSKYIVRQDRNLNTLQVLEVQSPDLLTLSTLRSVYGESKPAVEKTKLIEIRELLQSRKLLQANLITTLESNLKNYRTGLNSTIITELAGLLETNTDTLRLILSQTEGKLYEKGKIRPLEFLSQINEVFQDQYLDLESDLNLDLKQINKILELVKQFALTEEEVAALLDNPLIFNLQPESLLNPTQADLNWLFTFTKLKEVFDGDGSGLINVLNRLEESDSKSIEEFTDWSIEDINTLANGINNNKREIKGLSLQFPYNTVPKLERLNHAFYLLQTLGINAEFLLDLAQTSNLNDFEPLKEKSDPRYEFYQRHAENLFNLVRAKYTDEQWERVWKPLHAVLATQKRDSLLAVTLEELYQSGKIIGRKSPDLLYEYLLLDVQTESEVNTSRIVQGIASLQLYIQRCLCSLEKEVNSKSIPEKEWLWMKNYRVWEANRKVFLYPENYIEPELRDTKTPEFEDLIQELTQIDLSKVDLNKDSSVSTAFTNYLDKFAELANLRIVGSYLSKNFDSDKNVKGDTVLFLVGRSNSNPRIYYYREYIVNKDKWNPWRKINLTINSDYATPVYAFNKLFLFWVEFSKVNKSVGEGENRKDIPVFKSIIKYSYYNFNKSWVVPQSYVDLERELNEAQIVEPKWQRVYAQRTLENFPKPPQNIPDGVISNVNTLIVSRKTNISRDTNFNTDNLTWSFWLFFDQTVESLNGEVKEDGLTERERSLTIFKYESEASSLEAKAINKFSRISGAPNIGEIENIISSLQDNIAAIQVRINEIQERIDNATNDQERETAQAELETEQANLATEQGKLLTEQANLEAAKQEPQWESKRLEFSFQISGAEIQPKLNLEYDKWQHIAIVTQKIGDTNNYKVTVYISTEDDTVVGNIQESEFTLPVNNIIGINGVLAIGRNDNNLNIEEYFKANMSEFRLWEKARDKETIFRERDERKRDDKIGLLHFSLDQISPENGTIQQNSSLDLRRVFPPITPIESRERIVMFFGNERVTLRDSLDNEKYIKVFIRNNSGSEKSYDLIPNKSQLSITINDGVSNFNEYIPGSKTTQDRRKLTEEFDALEKYTLDNCDASDPFSEFVQDFLHGCSNKRRRMRFLSNSLIKLEQLENFWDRNTLLKNLNQIEVSLIDVNNQPGWYILNSGDEQFLITADRENLQTLEQRLDYGYSLDRRDIYSSQPVVISINNDPLLESDSNNPSDASKPEFKYKFKRLSTFAIYELSLNLFENGLDGLLSFESQNITEREFNSYKPNSKLVINPPEQSAQIDFDGANGIYYREIFFHIPFLIANQLNANQNFKEAQKFYHYIFNPTAQDRNNNTDSYWQFKPFRDFSLETISEMLSNEEALNDYRKDPFDPHAIARLRINTYQKAVVMKYIDNLLDWGDYLFRQDTRESINEAIPLYVLAFNLMGSRPTSKPKREFEEVGHYQDIVNELERNGIEELPDFLVQSNLETNNDNKEAKIPFDPNYSVITRFCVPENKVFLGYWDRVEDRLFKIRNSLNIDGVFRSLDLFQPPIDPAALVRAVAAGGLAGGLSAALASVNLPVPHYRYSVMVEKAKEMLRQAIELGGALLQALEKKDAEELTLLLNNHELNLLNRTTAIRKLQKEEVEINLKALEVSLQNLQEQKAEYERRINKGISSREQAEISLLRSASALRVASGALVTAASAVGATPDITVGGAGSMGSPVALTTIGGTQGSSSLNLAGTVLEIGSDIVGTEAQTTGIFANYERRTEDWELQKSIANFDIAQIEEQIEANSVQIEMASREIQIHEQTITQQKELGDFYRSKFSNKDLYNWMSNRLSGLYFQTYKLAFDLAKQAERAFQFEYGTNESFINFGHWDSRRKGLLAGEALRLDLARLEKASLDQHKRYLEITKHISLIRHDPFALLQLKETGRCQFNLDELLFDRDFPGHYFRVIKSISISIPAIIGPYQTFKATLTQTGHKTLLRPDIAGVKYLVGEEQEAPTSLRADFRANQQIAISTGVEDSGMFELNFNDGRYLPFEGTGAVSSWLLEMPKATNAIDFSTISDVIVHVRYACKSDGGKFKQDVMDLETFKNYQGMRLISMAHEFPNQWHSYKNSSDSDFEIPITPNLFPPNVVFDSNIDNFELQQALSIDENDIYSEANVDFQGINEDSLTIIPNRLKKEAVQDLILLVSYTGTIAT